MGHGLSQLGQGRQDVLVRGAHPVVHLHEPPSDHTVAIDEEYRGVRPATAIGVEEAVPPDYSRAGVGHEREVERLVVLRADALQQDLRFFGTIDRDGEDLGFRTLPFVQQVLQLT
jgi:hypothetical protein